MKHWKILHRLKGKNSRERQKEIIETLLVNRGLKTSSQQNDFLKPVSPFKITLEKAGLDEKEIVRAIARIKKAVDKGETIVVFGDYDADGITATAIIWELLHRFYPKVHPYLPDRVEEGYGISKVGVDAVLKKFNPGLIITVDNGVSAKEGLYYAKTKGIDVLILDHHVLPPEKPACFALVHSLVTSASGVAWFFSREFLLRFPRQKKLDAKATVFLQEKLSLATIGVISDVLPLVGINRSLVVSGLEQLGKTERPGLLALFKVAAISPSEIDSYHVAYIIAPRINAAGRISEAIDSLRLLCTRSPERGYKLAGILNSVNLKRQKMTQETFLHARQTFVKSTSFGKNDLIFVSHKDYNQGIIGLVAGKLVEQFNRPSFVISEGEIFSKASVRSISGLNIIALIKKTEKLLLNYGGHPLAAGFTVKTANLLGLKREMTRLVSESLTEDLLTKTVTVDCEIGLSDIQFSLLDRLLEFKPYGQKNPEPQFATSDLKVTRARLVGKDNLHLKLSIRDDSGNELEGIAFMKGEVFARIKKESRVDLVYVLTENDWNQKIELKIKEIRLH